MSMGRITKEPGHVSVTLWATYDGGARVELRGLLDTKTARKLIAKVDRKLSEYRERLHD